MFRIVLSFLVILLLNNALAAELGEIKIGWIGPLTGPSAALGIDSVPAMKMVFDKVNSEGGVNGRKIKLIIEDDSYESSKTVKAYHKLVYKDKVKVIVVVTYGGLFAISKKAKKDNVLLIDPLDCDKKIGKLPNNVICIANQSEELGELIAKSINKNNLFPAGVVYFDGDPFMPTVFSAANKKLQAFNKNFKFIQTYDNSTNDFKQILLKAKKYNLKSLVFLGYDQMGLAMKQAKLFKINSKFYALNTITSPGFIKLGGNSLNGTIVPLWQAKRGKEFNNFLSDFSKRVGREPFLEISTVPSFDIAKILVKHLKKNDRKGDNYNSFKDTFYSLSNYQGLSGIITIDSDGVTRSLKANVMEYIGEGKFVEVKQD